MYVDETVGLDQSQKDQIINMMDIFNIRCIEKKIDGVLFYEVEFIPILYRNTEYYITINTITSLIRFLEFKHIHINQQGFVTFVFMPYNSKIFAEIKELSVKIKVL